jgi:hypothetical protein
MTRKLFSLAIFGLTCGLAIAQVPKPVPAASVAAANTKSKANVTAKTAPQAPEPGTMVLRTKGQPDRKVVILKSTKTDNGRIFTEVKDIQTGEVFLVADQSAGGMKDAPAKSTTAMMAKPEAKKATAALPKAKPRSADPFVAPVKTKDVTTRAAKPVAMAPAPKPAVSEPKKLPVSAMKVDPNGMPSPYAADKPVMTSKPVSGNDPIHVVLPVGYVPPEFRMKQETADTMTALQSAVRPTARQDAATALSEGRYADRMEIKMALAHSAMHDPAPVVRAHCIDCLTKLGYCAPDYVDHLRQCAVGTESCLKVAASNALMKLEPKK